MIKKNPEFPTFSRHDLSDSSSLVAESIIKFGVCYISGFESNLPTIRNEFSQLDVASSSEIKALSPSFSKEHAPCAYSVLYSKDFLRVKRKILGPLFNNEIEIFCQHTPQHNSPPSGVLHFDKRPTFKLWYYLNDIGSAQGAMRVVPNYKHPQNAPSRLRQKIGTRRLFSESSVHHADQEVREKLEASAEFVTGSAGTLFIHYTESWHGASPVQEGCHRTIMRSHSRSALNYLQR